jgi:uncharacterized Zn-finger protein
MARQARWIGCHPSISAFEGSMVVGERSETFHVDDATVACDGGGGALGHPRVYLNITTGGMIDCPYCSRRYILNKDAKPGAGH